MKSWVEKVMQGVQYVPGNDLKVEKIEWKNHPEYTGVRLKRLIEEKNLGGKVNLYLVEIMSCCEIGFHLHDGHWEFHQVISGNGECHVEDKIISYETGVGNIFPPGVEHGIMAGEEGLYLFACFVAK